MDITDINWYTLLEKNHHFWPSEWYLVYIPKRELVKLFFIIAIKESTLLLRDAPRGGAGGAAAPPDFGRSEGAAGQRRRPALLPAPPDF